VEPIKLKSGTNRRYSGGTVRYEVDSSGKVKMVETGCISNGVNKGGGHSGGVGKRARRKTRWYNRAAGNSRD